MVFKTYTHLFCQTSVTTLWYVNFSNSKILAIVFWFCLAVVAKYHFVCDAVSESGILIRLETLMQAVWWRRRAIPYGAPDVTKIRTWRYGFYPVISQHGSCNITGLVLWRTSSDGDPIILRDLLVGIFSDPIMLRGLTIPTIIHTCYQSRSCVKLCSKIGRFIDSIIFKTPIVFETPIVLIKTCIILNYAHKIHFEILHITWLLTVHFMTL